MRRIEKQAKERPILFSAPMVRAILEGRKTQTRRVLKKQPIDVLPCKGNLQWVTLKEKNPNHGQIIRCRFGQPGDRLWVRETWARVIISTQRHEGYGTAYKADENKFIPKFYVGKWNPSIHMPKDKSRILLEITDVRVERLQEISEEDAMVEGMPLDNFLSGEMGVDWFRKLWDTVNKPDSPNGWNANPWVWVITFRRIKE